MKDRNVYLRLDDPLLYKDPREVFGMMMCDGFCCSLLLLLYVCQYYYRGCPFSFTSGWTLFLYVFFFFFFSSVVDRAKRMRFSTPLMDLVDIYIYIDIQTSRGSIVEKHERVVLVFLLSSLGCNCCLSKLTVIKLF